MKRRIALALAPALLTGLVLGGGIAQSAPTKHKKAVVKKPAAEPGRLGTPQMAGGDGHFGQTYTLTDGNGIGPYNFTLTSAEYAVGRHNKDDSNSYAVPTGQKFLIIHYRVKNPTKQDFDYYPGPFFQTVDADGTTVDSSGDERRTSQHQAFGEITLKPGQGIDDLEDYAVVTGKGSLTKIIIKLHRVGTHCFVPQLG